MLHQKVLILNADFRALTVCTMSKAFLLIYLNKAEMVTKVKNGLLRSVNQTFAMPSVIRLYNYVKMPYRGVILTRQNLFKRDFYTCLYCSSKKNLTLDHVIPKSKGGKTTWTNLVTACQNCNSRKSDYTLKEAGLTLPYKPFKPSFVIFAKNFSKWGDASWELYLQ
jgi:5-methylcytosine-specific restriction endonuclease McrA